MAACRCVWRMAHATLRVRNSLCAFSLSCRASASTRRDSLSCLSLSMVDNGAASPRYAEYKDAKTRPSDSSKWVVEYPAPRHQQRRRSTLAGAPRRGGGPWLSCLHLSLWLMNYTEHGTVHAEKACPARGAGNNKNE